MYLTGGVHPWNLATVGEFWLAVRMCLSSSQHTHTTYALLEAHFINYYFSYCVFRFVALHLNAWNLSFHLRFFRKNSFATWWTKTGWFPSSVLLEILRYWMAWRATTFCMASVATLVACRLCALWFAVSDTVFCGWSAVWFGAIRFGSVVVRSQSYSVNFLTPQVHTKFLSILHYIRQTP